MRTDLYGQMVATINAHCSWVMVGNDKAFIVWSLIIDNCDIECACRTLVLRSTTRENGYRKGMEWKIPEQDLDAALATLRKLDTELRERLKADNPQFTLTDIEQLIATATHCIIKLRLNKVPNNPLINNHLTPRILFANYSY